MMSFLLAAMFAVQGAGPTCTLPDGHVVTVELALSEEQKALGLMFRDYLPPNQGMLFLFSQDDYLPFWMKNTLIPLDFIWLDAYGTVVDVKHSAPPCKLDPCPSYKPSRPARAVLELVGGQAAAHGVKPGARIRCAGVVGFPRPSEGQP
ncbi:MAG: DUF192 domain-containing protein [Thermoanaerobaculum sp.]|nr:DUF192 domain-containing protein [Thermoanaerobaculum sp.]